MRAVVEEGEDVAKVTKMLEITSTVLNNTPFYCPAMIAVMRDASIDDWEIDADNGNVCTKMIELLKRASGGRLTQQIASRSHEHITLTT